MARSAADWGAKVLRFITFATVFLVVAALYFGSEIFIPLALAILLSFLLTPAVRWFEKWKLPRIAATLIVVAIGGALVCSIGYVVYHQFVSVVEELPQYRGELSAKWNRLRQHGGAIKRAEQEFHNLTATSQPASQPANPATAVREALPGAGPSPAPGPGQPPAPWTNENPLPVRTVTPPQSTLQSTVATVGEYASKFLSPMATALLVLVLVIFMLLMREDLRDRMIRLIGHGRLNITTQAIDEAGSRISKYLGALAIVNGAYGAIVAGGLWAAGHLFGHGNAFPNVLVWGLLVGLFRFVPYIGIWIGAAFPILLSFAIFPGSGVFFAVLALFILMEAVVSQFIEPYWYGASTGMSPLAVLVAAVFWTWLWGAVGLLLSTPLTVCLVVMGKYVPGLRFLDILLGDEPVLPPHVRFYQRLIASDEEETVDLASEMLKDHTLEQVYDEMIVPALLLAEQDHHRERLEGHRLAEIQQHVREIVEELGDAARAKRVRLAAEETEQAAKDQPPGPDQPRPRPPLPKDCQVNVLSLPAKGATDELVAVMLTQLLELRGYCATFATADQLASEMVERIETERAHMVCVSAMPPAAVAHARYLCKRIHARFPDLNMIVGVWHAKQDPDRLKDRIACDESVRLVTTLAKAQDELDQLAKSVALQPAAEQMSQNVP
ncbi:MAG TPA: AI-2E family transporter [Tepidisphaeraceae bacterium]|jgi:predicted PurR-regulated permease PerM